MATLFSINFSFENVEHTCLITTKWVDEKRMYKITIMNGELEQLLFGENYLKEVDGIIELPATQELRYQKLKVAIAESLQKHLEEMEQLQLTVDR